MAEDKSNKLEKTDKAVSKTPDKALATKTPVKKVKGNNRVARWFREMKSELKKVVWPTPKQITNNTFVALTVMSVAAVAIWILDYLGGQIFLAIRMLARG